jgi:RNA polymerase sigma factor (TIGR02999 family)
MARERAGNTLQSTALVHEAYLRLQKQDRVKVFENRSHLIAICAQLMRQILVESARRRRASKRGGRYRITLDDSVKVGNIRDVELLELDDALHRLAELDSRQAQIVELKFFGGLSIEEISDYLKVSPATIKRDWATARVWLHREITGASARDT